MLKARPPWFCLCSSVCCLYYRQYFRETPVPSKDGAVLDKTGLWGRTQLPCKQGRVAAQCFVCLLFALTGAGAFCLASLLTKTSELRQYDYRSLYNTAESGWSLGPRLDNKGSVDTGDLKHSKIRALRPRSVKREYTYGGDCSIWCRAGT
jgi:hypothetical protein